MRLNCVTLRDEYPDLVLFTAPASDEQEHRTGSEPAPAARLLLHGSVRHLLGSEPQVVNGPELTGFDGGASYGRVFLTSAGQAVSALAAGRRTSGAPHVDPVSLPAEGVRRLLNRIDIESGGLDTSVPMTGYARVTVSLPGTATVPGCLVASPLIVQYSA